MIYKNGTKNFVKNFRRAGKNWKGSRGGKFLPASRQQNCEAILRQSASGFCSKKVLTSSSKHHHIELAASLGASPLASAGRFARKLKGFLKSIESFCWLIWRFANLESLLVLKNESRFFSFAEGKRQSEILLNCQCKALPFSIIIKE